MMDSETRRFVQEEIKRHLNIILNAQAGENTEQSETVDQLYPGMPGITGRPVMHPYGFASRARRGTISVVAKVGADVHNRMTMGHRDSGRPTDLQEGESCLYSANGRRVNARNDRIEILYDASGTAIVLQDQKVQVGSPASSEPMVLGNILVTFMTNLLTQLDTLLTSMGAAPSCDFPPGTPLTVNAAYAAAIAAIKAQITLIKTTYLSTPSSNIISQKTFTERGGS